MDDHFQKYVKEINYHSKNNGNIFTKNQYDLYLNKENI